MRLFLLALFVVTLTACGSGQALPAAPVGERPVLERLAKAYEAMSDQVSENPRRLPPDERLRFVRFVFEKAGYDYDKTLQAMARAHLDPMNTLQRDMAELLLLPHRAGGWVKPETVYSQDELSWVTRIEDTFF